MEKEFIVQTTVTKSSCYRGEKSINGVPTTKWWVHIGFLGKGIEADFTFPEDFAATAVFQMLVQIEKAFI